MSGSSVVRKHTQIGMYRSIENKQKLGWLLQNGHNWLPSGSEFFDTSLCLWTSNIQYSCLEALRMAIMLTPNNQYMSTPEWDLTSKLVQPPIIDGYIIFISACPHSCLVKCTSRWYLRYYDPITVWSNGYVWKLVINPPSYGYLNRKKPCSHQPSRRGYWPRLLYLESAIPKTVILVFIPNQPGFRLFYQENFQMKAPYRPYRSSISTFPYLRRASKDGESLCATATSATALLTLRCGVEIAWKYQESS